MMIHDKFLSLMKQLLQKSQYDQVVWKQCKSSDISGRYTGQKVERISYCVAISSTISIRIEFLSPESSFDAVRAMIYDSEAIVYDRLSEESDDDYQLLTSLYIDAQRCVVGWDKSFAIIEDKLTSEEIVGQESVEALTR